MFFSLLLSSDALKKNNNNGWYIQFPPVNDFKVRFLPLTFPLTVVVCRNLARGSENRRVIMVRTVFFS